MTMYEVRKILLSVDDTLHVLSIGRTKLLELTYKGLIPSVKIGKRRLYPLDLVTQWANEQATGGATKPSTYERSEPMTMVQRANDEVFCADCGSSNLNESLTICFECQGLDYLEEANEDVDPDNSL